jgi:hypothetical protein
MLLGSNFPWWHDGVVINSQCRTKVPTISWHLELGVFCLSAGSSRVGTWFQMYGRSGWRRYRQNSYHAAKCWQRAGRKVPFARFLGSEVALELPRVLGNDGLLSQNDPEQPVDGTQSRARSFSVQSQQLLPKGEVLQEEFFSGAKDGEDPAQQMSKAHKHRGIIAKSAPGRMLLRAIDSAIAQSFGEAQGVRLQSVYLATVCLTLYFGSVSKFAIGT